MNTLLIVGFGDIVRRAVPQLRTHFTLTALIRARADLQSAGLDGVLLEEGDLDQPASLQRHAGRATHVLHCAPPPNRATTDPRTANLLAMLASAAPLPRRLVYISTSGVYGDCGGDTVDERRPPHPATDRARRRLDAEQRIATFAGTHGVAHVILRAPGIYAADRLPLARLRAGTPVLRATDDVYTNHIHADDLASIAVQALIHPDAHGVYNACDDTVLRMGDWFDLIADRAGMPRPPRIARSQAPGLIPAPLLSFMGESRRLSNRRMKDELGVKLRYPTVFEGLPATIEAGGE